MAAKSPRKIPYPFTETEDEQRATITRMGKAHPDWTFAVCPQCKTWGVENAMVDGLHPLCWAALPKSKRPKPQTNQTSLI